MNDKRLRMLLHNLWKPKSRALATYRSIELSKETLKDSSLNTLNL